jgi:hypothetical protein
MQTRVSTVSARCRTPRSDARTRRSRLMNPLRQPPLLYRARSNGGQRPDTNAVLSTSPRPLRISSHPECFTRLVPPQPSTTLLRSLAHRCNGGRAVPRGHLVALIARDPSTRGGSASPEEKDQAPGRRGTTALHGKRHSVEDGGERRADPRAPRSGLAAGYILSLLFDKHG